MNKSISIVSIFFVLLSQGAWGANELLTQKCLTDCGPNLTEAISGLNAYFKRVGRPQVDREEILQEVLPYYNAVVLVNAAIKGSTAQKMSIFERDATGKFKMALWDQNYWADQGVNASLQNPPPYSWLVSTGRKHNDGLPSGPTVNGIFNLDDRPGRQSRSIKFGFYSKGMYDAQFIDLHYDGGRRSGVAFHGTTPKMYRRLGRRDSHGCVRMHQDNSELFLDWRLNETNSISGELTGGSVPRFFRKQTRSGRANYNRNGSLLTDSNGNTRFKSAPKILVFIYEKGN